ncbi:YfiR family protein [Hydrogenimonas sp.]
MRALAALLSLLLLAPPLAAYLYNDSLLLIYAKIVPRIMALDHTPRTLKGARRTLCILYEKGDDRVARELAKSIEHHLPKTGKPYRVTAIPYERVEQCDGAVSFLLLPTGDEKLRRALRYAHANKLLTFAYDKAMLRHGAVVSIHPGKRVYPLINIEAVKKERLELDPTLLQVAKIYRGEER